MGAEVNLLGKLIDLTHPINRGCVAWWPMIEGGGEKINDIVPNPNHGLTKNNPLWNEALTFDGSNDYVDLGSKVYLNSALPFTISAWVYLESFSSSSYPTIISLKADTTNSLQLGLSNIYTGIYFGSATSWYGGKAGSTPTLGVWTHVVLTFDGVSFSTNSSFKVYKNNSIQTITVTGAFAANTTNRIGTDGGNEWNGRIRDVRIWNRVLSTNGIAQLYNTPFIGMYQPNKGKYFLPTVVATGRSYGFIIG